MFFRLLLKFPGSRYADLLPLVENIYNNTPHSGELNYNKSLACSTNTRIFLLLPTCSYLQFSLSGIFGLTPYKAHFCTHGSSIVARKLLSRHNKHQRLSKKTFDNLSKWQKIDTHDYVRVKTTPKLIQKESAVFYRATSDEQYQVTQVDRSEWPYVYSLGNFPIKNRRFYAWQLIKSKSKESSLPTDPHDLTTTNSEKIQVTNAIVTHPNRLRSTKSYSSTPEVTYQIFRNGKQEFVTESDLRLFKKLFGKHTLKYSTNFDQPHMEAYKI